MDAAHMGLGDGQEVRVVGDLLTGVGGYAFICEGNKRAGAPWLFSLSSRHRDSPGSGLRVSMGRLFGHPSPQCGVTRLPVVLL